MWAQIVLIMSLFYDTLVNVLEKEPLSGIYEKIPSSSVLS